VAHGIEVPQAGARGPAEIGEIPPRAEAGGNEVQLALADDGAGLNTSAFARKRSSKD